MPAALESGIQDYGATMAEATDSYCERCGARYVFAANVPKRPALEGARVLARGLKKFVLTDSQSIGDAVALVRQEDGRQGSNQVNETFNRIFNFCLTCRQYACDRCWNPKAAACLSCAPDADLPLGAPEELPIDRTPVSRWGINWSAFPGGPAPEALADPAPQAHFDDPVHLGEPGPKRQLQASAFPSWPTVDLPPGPTSAAAGPTRTAGIASSKPADGEAWSLWPIADEIAPDMTLTPEELELVEARLGQSESAHGSAGDLVTAPEPPLRDAPPTPWAPQHTLAEDVARPADRASGLVNRLVPSEPAWEPEAAVTDHGPDLAAPMTDRPVCPEPEGEDRHGRILRNLVTTMPPLSSLSTPQPEARRHVPIMARLLGRRASQPEAPASTQRNAARAPSGELSGDLWPIPTKWLDRPIRADDRPRATEASAENVGPQQLAPSFDPVPAPALPAENPERVVPQELRVDAPEPVPQALEQCQIDGRYAAAVRLSVVSNGAVEPVAAADRVDQAARSESEPDPEMASLWAAAPAEPPARPEFDQDLAEAFRLGSAEALDRDRAGSSVPEAETSQVPAGSSSPATTPPSSWPPLGASWPAREDPGATWPGPHAPLASAVLAAQQAATPILAEMWAQSAEQVLNRGSVRVCHGCALPVSPRARYCRRCGTHQA